MPDLTLGKRRWWALSRPKSYRYRITSTLQTCFDLLLGTGTVLYQLCSVLSLAQIANRDSYWTRNLPRHVLFELAPRKELLLSNFSLFRTCSGDVFREAKEGATEQLLPSAVNAKWSISALWSVHFQTKRGCLDCTPRKRGLLEVRSRCWFSNKHMFGGLTV